MKTTSKDKRCLVTAKEVAEHLSISVRTVRRWMADGILPFHRIGPRLVRFNLEEVRSKLIIE